MDSKTQKHVTCDFIKSNIYAINKEYNKLTITLE